MNKCIKISFTILAFILLIIFSIAGYRNKGSISNENEEDDGLGEYSSSTTGAIFLSNDDSDDYRQAGQQTYIYENYIHSYSINCNISSGALYLRVYSFDADKIDATVDEKVDYSNTLMEMKFTESGLYEGDIDLPIGCYWFVIEEENKNVTARAKLTIILQREE